MHGSVGALLVCVYACGLLLVVGLACRLATGGRGGSHGRHGQSKTSLWHALPVSVLWGRKKGGLIEFMPWTTHGIWGRRRGLACCLSEANHMNAADSRLPLRQAGILVDRDASRRTGMFDVRGKDTSWTGFLCLLPPPPHPPLPFHLPSPSQPLPSKYGYHTKSGA